MDQPIIERMLRLLALLSGNIEYTVDELAGKLEMSQRTIYRYIDTCGGKPTKTRLVSLNRDT